MPKRLMCVVALSAALTATAAAAQPPSPPPENITITATKLREMVDAFVKSSLVATHITGKVARWERGICPVVVGQSPAIVSTVTAQLKTVASVVGAPVDADKSCTPNIEIVFSTTPQALLDNIKRDDPDYLGYAMSGSEQEALATISRPVQAWYETETVDLDGMRRIDSARHMETGITMSNFGALAMPSTSTARVTGNHINDGTHSAFHHIVIIVDSSKLVGQKLAPLADYIAMLALTQLRSVDACQQLPSITNNFAAGCQQKAEGITAIDASYLRGLYKMDADKGLLFQQSDIADKMLKDAKGP